MNKLMLWNKTTVILMHGWSWVPQLTYNGRVDNIQQIEKKISPSNPDIVMTTDASKQG